MQSSGNTTITLHDIVSRVDGVDPESEIVVVSHGAVSSMRALFPIRFDAVVMVLVDRGSGRIEIDTESYEVGEGTLITLQPRNYLNGFECSVDSQSTVFACSMKVMESVVPKVADMLPLILSRRTSPVIRLGEEEGSTVRWLLNYIKERTARPRTQFFRNKLDGIVQALLYEVLDIKLAGAGVEVNKSRREELMTRFLISVSRNFKEHRDLSFYADELCISVKYMSALVREVSGRTPGDWIESYVIMEAKMLLRTTDLSVQEISHRMNFANQSFFGKYFRKNTGLSPVEFRRSWGKPGAVESIAASKKGCAGSGSLSEI